MYCIPKHSIRRYCSAASLSVALHPCKESCQGPDTFVTMLGRTVVVQRFLNRMHKDLRAFFQLAYLWQCHAVNRPTPVTFTPLSVYGLCCHLRPASSRAYAASKSPSGAELVAFASSSGLVKISPLRLTWDRQRPAEYVTCKAIYRPRLQQLQQTCVYAACQIKQVPQNTNSYLWQ